MATDPDNQSSFFARIPLPSKIAAALFVVAKVHGIAGVLTMFVHRPLAAFLLTVAGVTLASSAALAMRQMLELRRPRTLQEKLDWHRAEAARIESELSGG